MSRSLTGTVNTALQGSNVPLLIFVEMDFTSGFLRCTNAGYTIRWPNPGGYDWLGLGRIGGIGEIEEGGELQARDIQLTLSGIPSAMMSVALGEHYQGRSCKLWFAPCNSNYRALADPVGPFVYRMNTMNGRHGRTGTIVLTCEARMADWDRPRSRRWNHPDQQRDYPGDRFFEHAEMLVEKALIW